MKATSWMTGLLMIGGSLLIVACGGPVQVGGGDDDDDNATPTPTAAQGSFVVSISDPTIEVHQGWMTMSTLTVTGGDGYTGTITLTLPTKSGVTFTLSSATVTLDATTTTATVDVTIESVLADDGTTLSAPGSSVEDITFNASDGILSDSVVSSLEVSDYVFFKLRAGIDSDTADLFHEVYEAQVGAFVFFVGMDPNAAEESTFDHVIHGSSLSNSTHQNQALIMLNNLAYNPRSGQSVDMNQINPDLSVATSIDAAGDQGTFYCHNHQAGGSNIVFHGDGAATNPSLVIVP